MQRAYADAAGVYRDRGVWVLGWIWLDVVAVGRWGIKRGRHRCQGIVQNDVIGPLKTKKTVIFFVPGIQALWSPLKLPSTIARKPTTPPRAPHLFTFFFSTSLPDCMHQPLTCKKQCPPPCQREMKRLSPIFDRSFVDGERVASERDQAASLWKVLAFLLPYGVLIFPLCFQHHPRWGHTGICDFVAQWAEGAYKTPLKSAQSYNEGNPSSKRTKGVREQ